MEMTAFVSALKKSVRGRLDSALSSLDVCSSVIDQTHSKAFLSPQPRSRQHSSFLFSSEFSLLTFLAPPRVPLSF